jgi:hypothetical protein
VALLLRRLRVAHEHVALSAHGCQGFLGRRQLVAQALVQAAQLHDLPALIGADALELVNDAASVRVSGPAARQAHAKPSDVTPVTAR